MPGRLAIDFGTSNTILAVWDETRKIGIPISLPEFSQSILEGSESVPVVPSLIHYTTDQRRWIGNQVLARELYQSDHTFRWMKRYISHRSPNRLRIGGQEISYFNAGRDYLSAVLGVAIQELGIRDEEIALSIPVEAYEHYEDWLGEVARAAGLPRFRLIDEPSAAALGYGAHILPGNVYLIFDFGGGTLHAAVVLIESEEAIQGGRRCRVLGKAGREIGGTTIDQWIFQEFLRCNQLNDSDDEIRQISSALLVGCEGLKEKLSFTDQASLSIANPLNGRSLSMDLTRPAFEELLDQHDLFSEIDRAVRSALNSARERGYAPDDIKAALMIGGSSQIPSVQRTLRQIFGKERVMMDHPWDAVARGAAAFVAGVDFYDHIQHDYAIRYVNPKKGGYDYRVIVKRGTPYPTNDGICRLSVKATYDGQTQLGLTIFEMGERHKISGPAPVELVFDPMGAVRLMPISLDEQEHRTAFWMNEHNPTFLTADPPAKQGESRFEVEFNIDGNKRLLVTARDIRTGRLVLQDYPVVKLT